MNQISEAQELLEIYRENCASKCGAFILIEDIGELPTEWDDGSLSSFIHARTTKLGTIPCGYETIDEPFGKRLIRRVFERPMLLEAPPFYGAPEGLMNDFLTRLYKLAGPSQILSNLKFQRNDMSSYSYSDIFSENEDYETDVGLAIISSEWFIFFAHRGYDKCITRP